MKHKLVSLALTAMLLLSACTASPAATNTDAADPPNSAAPVSESVLPEVNKESAAAEITASLADYAAPEYISISNANSITEIILFNPETAVQLIKAKASGNSPDEWAYTKDELAALSAELPPLAGTEQTAIYLKDEKDGEIYLTVLNGSVIFDQFESLSPSQNQAPSATPSTLGEKNALNQAKNYLALMPFSYEGLVKQLEFEGYTSSEAIFAATNCGADWNEQAAKKAESYLDLMSFSRQGLIEQLEFEGFTTTQAEYGASAVGY